MLCTIVNVYWRQRALPKILPYGAPRLTRRPLLPPGRRQFRINEFEPSQGTLRLPSAFSECLRLSMPSFGVGPCTRLSSSEMSVGPEASALRLRNSGSHFNNLYLERATTIQVHRAQSLHTGKARHLASRHLRLDIHRGQSINRPIRSTTLDRLHHFQRTSLADTHHGSLCTL